jgi:hypothetical protein
VRLSALARKQAPVSLGSRSVCVSCGLPLQNSGLDNYFVRGATDSPHLGDSFLGRHFRKRLGVLHVGETYDEPTQVLIREVQFALKLVW